MIMGSPPPTTVGPTVHGTIPGAAIPSDQGFGIKAYQANFKEKGISMNSPGLGPAIVISKDPSLQGVVFTIIPPNGTNVGTAAVAPKGRTTENTTDRATKEHVFMFLFYSRASF